MSAVVMELDRLDRDRICEHLATDYIGQKVVVFESTASTNNIAAEYARNRANHGLAVFAEQQTNGKGRNGNIWASGKSDSLLCSIVITKENYSFEILSLTCAVATAETIGKVGKYHAKIKWPNDIFLGTKKAAGILLERRSFENHRAFIIGIGINSHQSERDFEEDIAKKATSLDIESGGICDRVSLARRLLICVENWLQIAKINSEMVITRWKELSNLYSRRVCVVFDGKKYSGNCIGVDPEKGLILQLDRGSVRMFHASQTSIAK